MNNLYVLVDHNQKMIIDHIRKLPEDWNNINGLNLLDKEKLYNLDWAGQIGLGWININDEVLNDYTSLPEWFEISKLGMKKLVSDERWKKEHDIVYFNGKTLELTERTKSSLNFQKVGMNSETEKIEWKFIEGFISLTVEEFTTLYNFVTQYIQNCFKEELRLIQLCDSAKTLEDLQKLDLTYTWPSNTSNI